MGTEINMTLDTTITWYLAGPMTNIPQFNVPLFNKVAAQMREEGVTIVSPPEQDSPTMQAASLASTDGDLAKLEKDTNETWGQVLGKDVTLVADDIGGILFLPDWHKSRGARLEAFVGLLTGKKFAGYFEAGSYDSHTYDSHTDTVRSTPFVAGVSADYVRFILRSNMP